MRIVGAFPHILPDAEKIDLRGVLESLPGLHHGSQGADLDAVQHPGVIFAADRGLVPLDPRRALAESGLDPGRVHVRRLDDMRVRRDHFERTHLATSSLAAMISPCPRNSLGVAILQVQAPCREEETGYPAERLAESPQCRCN